MKYRGKQYTGKQCNYKQEMERIKEERVEKSSSTLFFPRSQKNDGFRRGIATCLVWQEILGNMFHRKTTLALSAASKPFNACQTVKFEVQWACLEMMFQGATHQAQ